MMDAGAQQPWRHQTWLVILVGPLQLCDIDLALVRLIATGGRPSRAISNLTTTARAAKARRSAFSLPLRLTAMGDMICKRFSSPPSAEVLTFKQFRC